MSIVSSWLSGWLAGMAFWNMCNGEKITWIIFMAASLMQLALAINQYTTKLTKGGEAK